MSEKSYWVTKQLIHVIDSTELSWHQLNPECSCTPEQKTANFSGSGEELSTIWYHNQLNPAEGWENEGGA